MSLRIGIDIGGTFTDLVGFDPAGGQMYEHKVLTTPDEPAAGILKGIREMLAEAGLSPDILHDADILHGTTLVTNALIEQKGRPTALLTTRGAGDVLETGKENRYDPYDRLLKRPEPLVPRWRRHQINERLLADGSVRTELDRAQVARTLEALADEGVEAVAVCFLHSYADAGHEQAVREIAESLGLRLYISLSSDIAPEIGEWERVMTTTANAYIQPIVEGYLGQLRQALTEAGHRGRFYLMWSDGGLASAGATQAAPIRLLESGPAAGALAAGHFARSMDLPRVIAFDMGGTTAKICLITDGDPVRAPSFEVGRVHRDKRGSGLPVRVPSIQMLEIGAGGGSLAAADDLGFLKVGPQSAGAEPGPACYGLGGTEATVTDANLLLGYLPTESRLAGGLRLDSAKAETAVAEVAHRIGLSTQEAAVGVRRIVTSNMAQATQLHVTERGEDPRDYVLMAFGGASPLHAYDVARSLGIGRVVVPRGAGVLCSFGFLTARVGLETIQTLITPVRGVNTQLVQDTFAQLSRKAIDVLASAGVPADQSVLTYSLDMRYAGQGFEIQVAVPGPDGLDESRVTEAFNRTYFERYGVDHEGEPEIRACRIRAEGPDPAVPISTPVQQAAAGAARTRQVWFEELDGWTAARVYRIEELEPGHRYQGPLLVEAPHTTAAVGPGGALTMTAAGALTMDVPAKQRAKPKASVTARLDPVDLEILTARLRCIADEADHALMQTAYSSAVRDGKDYSLVIADTAGRCLALPTECMPLFVTSMPRTIGLLTEQFPVASLEEGDILLTNDPWLCAGHKSDLVLVAPVFHGGAAVAFIATILHVPDIGGVVGDFRAWDIYEEGLALPPVHLYRAGKLNEAVSAILRDNVRFPEVVLGDIAAMRAAISVATQRLTECLDDDPSLDLERVADEISGRASDAFLQRLKAIPMDTYHAELDADGILHLDGAARLPIHLEATIEVREQGLLIDFNGSDAQRPSQPINVPIPYTIADTIYALQYMLAPALPNVGPQFSPVKINAPEGSILNAVSPVPVFARTRTGVHIATLINAALAAAVPDLVQAECGHTTIFRISGVTDEGRFHELTLMPKGGMGATGGRDGWNCTVFPTNCMMVGTEVAETRCPVLISREMRPDSGGPGRERGGTGQVVTIESLDSRPLTISFRPNYTEHAPIGLNGGHPGAKTVVTVNGKLLDENPAVIESGGSFQVLTPGGGGIGAPHLRDPERVGIDVRAGLVSPEIARDIYRVAVSNARTGVIDQGETQRLRA